MGKGFNYAEEFKRLDLKAVKKDLLALMTDSQEWWPADFGHYGPLFIRMAWHSAGTYRTGDGRGGAGSGQQRFAPLNSWPDNANLDKARRLLWPVKRKYGRAISWADLMILAGNVALESMASRPSASAAAARTSGSPRKTSTGAPRANGSRTSATPASGVSRIRSLPCRWASSTSIGRPEREPGSDRGGEGHPRDVRPHGDERRGDRRADRGGHTFGKTTAPDPRPTWARARGQRHRGAGPRLKSSFGTGKGKDAITSGLEVTWTATPTKWSSGFFKNLFGYEWSSRRARPARTSGGRSRGAGGARCPMRTTSRSATRRPCSPPTSPCGSTPPTRRSRGGSWRTRISSRTPSPARGSS